LGLVWSILQVSRDPNRFGRRPAWTAVQLVDAGAWVLLGALIGGRAVFVWTNRAYFESRLLESMLVFQGGLSWPGALTGGLIFLPLAGWMAHLPTLRLADALVPLLLIVAISAHLGCALDGTAYGPEFPPPLGLPLPDEWGRTAARLPLQALAALLTLGLAFLLERCRPARPGRLAALALLGLGVIQLPASILRADPTVEWLMLRPQAWTALALILAAGPAYLILTWMEQR
jgi:phosphatidylglycerol:prolipoprotein diacylglycerol transferase